VNGWSVLLDRVDAKRRLSRLRPERPDFFPPALIPLAPMFGGASGLWVEPFAGTTCFVEWRPDEGCEPICHAPDDYFRWLAMEALDDEHPEAVEAILVDSGVDLDLAAVVERLGGGGASRDLLSELYRVAPPPPVLHVEAPQRVFDEAIAARELGRAWAALNSPGWELAATKRALVVLQDLSNVEALGLLARGWDAAFATAES